MAQGISTRVVDVSRRELPRGADARMRSSRPKWGSSGKKPGARPGNAAALNDQINPQIADRPSSNRPLAFANLLLLVSPGRLTQRPTRLLHQVHLDELVNVAAQDLVDVAALHFGTVVL